MSTVCDFIKAEPLDWRGAYSGHKEQAAQMCALAVLCSVRSIAACLSEEGGSCLAFIQSPIDQALSESSDS